MSELRFYTFVNFYLSSIQQGIQSAHVLHELFTKYVQDHDPYTSRLYDWAENHKTMIVLNGGMSADLTSLNMFLTCEANKLSFPAPWTSFSEDQASLGGIMTGVGIVLPEEIYNAVDYRKASTLIDDTNISKYLDEHRFYYVKDNAIVNQYAPDTPDHTLISKLKSCPLAR